MNQLTIMGTPSDQNDPVGGQNITVKMEPDVWIRDDQGPTKVCFLDKTVGLVVKMEVEVTEVTHVKEEITPFSVNEVKAVTKVKANLKSRRRCRRKIDGRSNRPKSVNQCLFCKKAYPNKPYKLEVHIRSHTGERPYQCAACPKNYNACHLLERHSKSHLDDRFKLHKCNKCDEKFLEIEQVRIHDFVHTGVKPYTCEICGKGFGYRYNLNQHKLSHTKTAGKRHQCPECPRKFISAAVLRKHLQKHEKGPPQNRCGFCPKVYRHRSALAQHVSLSHLGKAVPSIDCLFCGKCFTTRTRLNSHLLYHTKERPINCEMCNMTFVASGAKKEHILRVHTMERGHKCGKCEYACATIAALNRHRITHNTTLSFKCDICDKSFKSKHLVRRHRKIAHELTPMEKKRFMCEVCGLGFYGRSGLKQHEKFKHSTERPFKCELCGLGFKIKHHLNGHMQKVHGK